MKTVGGQQGEFETQFCLIVWDKWDYCSLFFLFFCVVVLDTNIIFFFLFFLSSILFFILAASVTILMGR